MSFSPSDNRIKFNPILPRFRPGPAVAPVRSELKEDHPEYITQPEFDSNTPPRPVWEDSEGNPTRNEALFPYSNVSNYIALRYLQDVGEDSRLRDLTSIISPDNDPYPAFPSEDGIKGRIKAGQLVCNALFNTKTFNFTASYDGDSKSLQVPAGSWYSVNTFDDEIREHYKHSGTERDFLCTRGQIFFDGAFTLDCRVGWWDFFRPRSIYSTAYHPDLTETISAHIFPYVLVRLRGLPDGGGDDLNVLSGELASIVESVIGSKPEPTEDSNCKFLGQNMLTVSEGDGTYNIAITATEQW